MASDSIPLRLPCPFVYILLGGLLSPTTVGGESTALLVAIFWAQEVGCSFFIGLCAMSRWGMGLGWPGYSMATPSLFLFPGPSETPGHVSYEAISSSVGSFLPPWP